MSSFLRSRALFNCNQELVIEQPSRGAAFVSDTSLRVCVHALSTTALSLLEFCHNNHCSERKLLVHIGCRSFLKIISVFDASIYFYGTWSKLQRIGCVFTQNSILFL